MDEVAEAIEKYQGLVPLVYDIETMGLAEARPQDMYYAVYLKREADKVIAEKDAEILRMIEDWNRLCEKYNKFIELKQEFCDKFKDIELEITK